MHTGMSESLARDVAPFNIKVIIVEPGAFRTNFLSAFVKTASGMTPAYKGTPVDDAVKKFEAFNGKQPGDPVKGSKAIVDVINAGCEARGERVLRLPLGSDCVGRMEEKMKALQHDLSAVRAIAESTGHE